MRGQIYRMLRLTTVFTLALALILVFAFQAPAATQAEQRKLALDLLEKLANTPPQDYQGQRRILEKIIDQCPDTDQAHDAYWTLSDVYQVYMGLPDYTAIAGLFEKYLKRYPDSPHASQARRELITAYEKLGKWDKVVNYYKQTLEGRALTDSEVMLDGLSYAKALDHSGKKTEAARWYNLIIERDRGMNSYAAQEARRQLNYLAADGVVENSSPRQPQASNAASPTPAPTSAPWMTPDPVPQPGQQQDETIEIVSHGPPPATPSAPPVPQPTVVTQSPQPTVTPASTSPKFQARCKLIKARSFRDVVGRGTTNADGSPDAHLRLTLGPGAPVITRIDLRAQGSIPGLWSTAHVSDAWPMAVLRHGTPAGGAGKPLYLAPDPDGEKLDLMIQDNNAIASGQPLAVTIVTSSGSRLNLSVER